MVKDKKIKCKAIPLSGIQYGYTLKEIAEYYGVHYTAVSKAIQKIEVKHKK